MNMGLEAHVKEEDAKNRRNLKLFLDRARGRKVAINIKRNI